MQVVRQSPEKVKLRLYREKRVVTPMSIRRKLFGTDGVRGVANQEPITSETALKLGRALAHVFRESRADAIAGF